VRRVSRRVVRRRVSISKVSCCSKIGLQRALNLARISSEGIMASRLFMREPEASLKVEPDDLFSISSVCVFR